MSYSTRERHSPESRAIDTKLVEPFSFTTPDSGPNLIEPSRNSNSHVRGDHFTPRTRFNVNFNFCSALCVCVCFFFSVIHKERKLENALCFENLGNDITKAVGNRRRHHARYQRRFVEPLIVRVEETHAVLRKRKHAHAHTSSKPRDATLSSVEQTRERLCSLVRAQNLLC